MDLEKLQELQVDFFNTLENLTKEGKVDWFRRTADPSLIFCILGHDLIVFELHDGTEENREPLNNPHGVLVKIRNCSFLWLEGLNGWERLLRLIRMATPDDTKFSMYQIRIMDWFLNDVTAK